MSICLYKTVVSKPIKDFTTGETNYVNSYSYCNKLKKRLGKKSCINCKVKNELKNDANEPDN
jgi:hypothetical protein